MLIKNVKIVTGDGSTVIDKGFISIHGDRIVEVSAQELPAQGEVIDADGCIALPGAINHHTHGVTTGPLFPSANKPLPQEKAVEHQIRHLCEGTTTILNVDGFATMDEVNEANTWTPLNVKTGTSHTPINIKAAQTVDGLGLQPKHLDYTVEQALREGAVCVGEIGGGHTLGGGGQDYLFIPRAIKEHTGKDLTPKQCRQLKVAVLSRYIDENAYDEQKVRAALKEVGLEGILTPEQCRRIISDCVLPSIALGLDAFTEAAQIAQKFNVPSIYHNSGPSKARMLEIVENYSRIIAGHSNHPSFDEDESVVFAGLLRSKGAIIDNATLDIFVGHKLMDTPDCFYKFYDAGIVDLVSTDYAAGAWDSVWMGVDGAYKNTRATLAQCVATATSNVERLIPGIAPDRGLLQSGKIADICISGGDNLASIKYVLVDGKVVVKDGRPTF